MLQTVDIEDVSSITYLGSTVSTTGGTGDDFKARIGKARVAFHLAKDMEVSGHNNVGQIAIIQQQCQC